MNQGKLDVIKQEMARVNINILEISELKWVGMSEFNSGDHYIYYCGQESPRKQWRTPHSQQKSPTRLSDFTSLTSYFITGEGNGGPLRYSCLENPMDRGA